MYDVLLPAQQVGLFQPGDGGAHARVVGGGIALKHLVLVLAQNLAGGGHHVAVEALLPVQVAERPENAVDLLPGEPRPRRHAELPLHVVRRVEQHATRRLPIPPGAACLLEIVLQRAGDVGVDHEAHVRLVDAHAEGVGRRDRAQGAADEALLHVLLGLRRHTGVKMLRRHVLQLQELRHLLAPPARRAIDDGAAGGVLRQIGLQHLMDVGELLATRGRDHLVAEVAALGAAVEDREFDAELLAEVPGDVLAHVGLRGRGQAQQRRYRPGSSLLADEAAHITVVGAEVVAPAREAVRLVQHPAADLALVERPAQGAAAELLRRDQEDARTPEPDPVQCLSPLGHGEHPVDGYAALDPPRLQPRHLVRHERDQGRDHHRQGAGLLVAGDRRDLVAERLARAGGQDAERVLARHRRLDDGLLQGTPVVMRWFGAKVVEAEPVLHLLAGVVPLPAPAAGGVGASRVPEPAHELPGLWELMAHPGRHDRVAAGDREPGQRVGQRPSGRRGFRDGLASVGRARFAV